MSLFSIALVDIRKDSIHSMFVLDFYFSIDKSKGSFKAVTVIRFNKPIHVAQFHYFVFFFHPKPFYILSLIICIKLLNYNSFVFYLFSLL